MKLRSLPVEHIIPMGEYKTHFSEIRCHVRIHDQAGGPYLAIHGENDEPDSEERPDEFYLNDEAEIDQFCAICKKLLRLARTEDNR